MKRTIAVFTAACLASTILTPTPVSARNQFGAIGAGLLSAAVVGALLSHALSQNRAHHHRSMPKARPVIVTHKRSYSPAHSTHARETETTETPPETSSPRERRTMPVVSAIVFVPAFLPPRPASGSPITDGKAVVPMIIDDEMSAQINDAPAMAASPLDNAIESFLIRARNGGTKPQIDRAIVVKALDSIYSNASVARLTALPDEGWTREVVQTHILRRAENLLPDFYAELTTGSKPQDVTLASLFDRAAVAALPTALEEQEAVAFSASYERFVGHVEAAAVAGHIGSQTAALTTPIVEKTLQVVSVLLPSIDSETDRRGLGVRGKLRARRILFDCLTENMPTRTPAGNFAQGAQVIPVSTLSKGASECAQRALDWFSASERLKPVPAESIWTTQGPMLNGKKWDMAFN